MPKSVENDLFAYMQAVYAAHEQLDWGTDPQAMRAAARKLGRLSPQHALVTALERRARQSLRVRALAEAARRPREA